jgi:hypothetical protein
MAFVLICGIETSLVPFHVETREFAWLYICQECATFINVISCENRKLPGDLRNVLIVILI